MQGSLGLVLSCLSAVLGVLTSLPTLLTLVLVTGCAAFFFARDMGKLKAGLRGLCSDRAAGCLKNAARRSTGTGRRCLLSYLLLTFITFCQACIILAILDVDYPFTISLVTAAADVLPVLGPGLVFAPLAVYQLLLGEYAKALGLLIGWGDHHPGPAGGRAPAGGSHRKGPPLDDAGWGVLLSGGGQPVGAPVRAGAVPALRRLPGEWGPPLPAAAGGGHKSPGLVKSPGLFRRVILFRTARRAASPRPPG